MLNQEELRSLEIMQEKPITINGRAYWSAKQFSKLTMRGEASVRYLIRKGNRVRKLKAEMIAGRIFIYAEELFEFPFVIPGKPESETVVTVEKFILKDRDGITTLSIGAEKIEICQ